MLKYPIIIHLGFLMWFESNEQHLPKKSLAGEFISWHWEDKSFTSSFALWGSQLTTFFSWENASKWKTRTVNPKVWRVQDLDVTQDSVSEENEAPLWYGCWPVTALESVLEMVKMQKASAVWAWTPNTRICKDVRAYTKQQTKSRDS